MVDKYRKLINKQYKMKKSYKDLFMVVAYIAGNIYNEETKGQKKLGIIRKKLQSYLDAYNEDRDAFIPKKPYQSWVLNEQTCLWESPVAKPTEELENNQYYSWNESIINWEIKTKE